MTRKFFGTDGVRGTANRGAMTAASMLRLAIATAGQFQNGDHRHRVVIGKDTRLSGYMIESALEAGFTSAGMDVILVGPLPTPAVAQLTRSLRADLGVMISASHNPYEDNGVKLFGPDGFKLSDEIEAAIETKMLAPDDKDLVAPISLGRATRLEDASGRYIEFVKSSLPRSTRFEGLKIALDCAHGAAYKVAPQVLWELGAELITIGDQPDGLNINAGCGSTDLDALKQTVTDYHCNIGIALDGDADRLIIIDERGETIDGDQLMGTIAQHWQQTGRLSRPGMVATVMSNLGLERFITNLGLSFERTAVGDRYVVEAMRASGFNIGGEQSGHIILSDYATTGDGLLAALQILCVLQRAGCPASTALRVFTPLPQKLQSIRYTGHDPLTTVAVKSVIAESTMALNGNGRILVRKSGTEPVIRVMAEGDDERQVTQIVDTICAEIKAA